VTIIYLKSVSRLADSNPNTDHRNVRCVTWTWSSCLLYRGGGGELCRKRGSLARERGRSEKSDPARRSDSARLGRRPRRRLGRLHDARPSLTDRSPPDLETGML